MDVDGAGGRPGGTPPLPRSIWVVAWGSLASQVLLLADRGVAFDSWAGVVLSVCFGALLVGYVSAGVVRARPVRFVLACVVMVLGALSELVNVLSAPGQDALDVLTLLASVAVLGALVVFRGSDWFLWQRTRSPDSGRAPIGPLVAVAVLVGVLGGVAAPQDGGLDAPVRVGAR